MAAEEGNKWWELRSKHGRDKIFSSPEILWEAACEYFTHTQNENRWDEQNWVGKEGQEVLKHHPTPFTIQGLALFLHIDSKTWWNYRNNESHKDFFPIITRIDDIIYKQKFEGAATGFFNPTIIARDLGLKDKQEIDQKHSIQEIEGIDIVETKK